MQDTAYMTKDLAGGLNREKKTYPKVSKGDNPMQKAVAETIEDKLMAEYQMFKESTDAARAAHEKAKELTQQGHDAERMGDEKEMRRKFADAALEKLKIKKAMQTKEDRLSEIGDTPAGKKALGSYIKQAASQATKLPTLKSRSDATDKEQERYSRKFGNRMQGIRKATDRLTKEERMDELSPKTLASYAKKASSSSHPNSASNLASRAGYELGQSDDADYTAGEKHDKKSATRSKFIAKAIDRLAR
jgi:hypothetical protein